MVRLSVSSWKDVSRDLSPISRQHIQIRVGHLLK